MMKFVTIFLFFSVYCSGEILKGIGEIQVLDLEPSRFTFVLRFESGGQPPRNEIPSSDLSAVREIGEIEISFHPSGMGKRICPFYITQYPDNEQFSLVGFYITDGYPHVLQIDTWDPKKKFSLFESFRSRRMVLTGALVQSDGNITKIN